MGANARERAIRTAIILTTLLLVAWLLASGTTQLLAAALFPMEEASQSATTMRSARTPLPGASHDAESAIARRVLARNMFDEETGSLSWDPPVAPPELSEDPTALETLPDGEPAPCEGSLRLVASMVVPARPELSFASLEESGAAMLYRTGMRVGTSQLVGIREQRVFLQPSGKPLCQVVMFKPEATSSARPTNDEEPDEKPARPKRASRKGGLSEEELDQGITKVSDTSYSISRDLVDKILGNQAELMRSARIIPYEENGQTVGVKVYGIRRNSLLGRLGMQNGDVLRTINGFDMASPDSALEAYTRLRSADQISVSMMRRGTPSNLEYSIR